MHIILTITTIDMNNYGITLDDYSHYSLKSAKVFTPFNRIAKHYAYTYVSYVY
jgi:hypothetical protein